METVFFGSEQDGGWSFYNSALASAFTYQHQSGVASTVKNLGGDSIAVSGKFYHLVVTMDRTSHIIRYFVNGKMKMTWAEGNVIVRYYPLDSDSLMIGLLQSESSELKLFMGEQQLDKIRGAAFRIAIGVDHIGHALKSEK